MVKTTKVRAPLGWDQFFLFRAIAGSLAFALAGPAFAVFTITEYFDSPPAHWTGEGNTTAPQDFGWKSTNIAGGLNAGELGGLFNSEPVPSHYSTSIGSINPKTTRLRMTGKVRYTGGGLNSAFAFLGWYNSSSAMLYPAPGSSIGFFTDTDGGFNEDGLRLSYQSGGVGDYHQWEFISRTLGINNYWRFVIDWDPFANGNFGRLSGTAIADDGVHYLEFNLPPGAKNAFTNFDRFGIVSTEQHPDYYRSQPMHFDDLTYTSAIPKPPTNQLRTQNFDSEPADWYGWNNKTGLNNFGWSNTNNAGLGAGEIGGPMARDGNTPDFAYYATPVGSLDASDETFTFSGTLNYKSPTLDYFMIGFFTPDDGVGIDSFPRNFMGFYSDNRTTFVRWYGDISGFGNPSDPIGQFPANTQLQFSLTYDPTGNSGNGTVTGSFGGTPFTYNLPTEFNFKDEFHGFTHFGLVTRNSHNDHTVFGRQTATYVDNLTYSTELPLALAGDYNGDGEVDSADYVVWRNTLGSSGSGLAADGNGNASVDAGDYDIWKSRYGNRLQPSATLAIPEPKSIVPLLLPLVASLFFRRTA